MVNCPNLGKDLVFKKDDEGTCKLTFEKDLQFSIYCDPNCTNGQSTLSPPITCCSNEDGNLTSEIKNQLPDGYNVQQAPSKKKIDCKNLGRKIMTDNNGNNIPNECRDIDFLAD